MISRLIVFLLTFILSNPFCFKLYKNDHFSIDYDSKWDLRIENNIVYLFSSKEDKNDIFKENLNIVTTEISDNSFTYAKLVDLAKKELLSIIDEQLILSEKEISISKVQALEIKYLKNIKSDNIDISLKINQIWLFHDKKIFLLTFTSEVSKYNIYSEIVNKMISSFSLN